jgi:hypothetical protein
MMSGDQTMSSMSSEAEAAAAITHHREANNNPGAPVDG